VDHRIPHSLSKNQPLTLLERATAWTASANHTQERPSVDYIIVEAYMVLIGGNRDSFRYHASKMNTLWRTAYA
jgi:hypothetical protein